MRADRKTVYVHIGLERTGTTSFQRYCTRHARDLLNAGVLYPTHSSTFSHNNHAPLAASYLPRERPVDHHLRQMAPHEDVVAALRAQIDAATVPAILLSSEHLSSRLRQPQIEAFAADLADYDCRIVVTLREHLSRFTSSYVAHVMSGSTQTLDAYAAMVLQPDNAYLRYEQMLHAWEAAFGRQAMRVVRYADDVLGALLGCVGVAGRTGSETLRYNRSLDRAAIEAVRLINVALASEQDGGASEDYVRFRRQDYIRSRLSHCLRHAGLGAGWDLRDDDQAMINAIAESDRRFLAETYDVDLGPAALPDCQAHDVQRTAGELLAAALVRSVCEQPAQRAALASRGAAHTLLEAGRRLTAWSRSPQSPLDGLTARRREAGSATTKRKSLS